MARGLYRLASYSLGKKLGLIPESFTFFISNLDLLQKSLSGNFSLKLRGVIETWKEGRRKKGEMTMLWWEKCLLNLESYNMGLTSSAVACWVILAKLCSISEYPFPLSM